MIYFDNSATTNMTKSVRETYDAVSQSYFGNPSSLHDLGQTASQLLQQSRKQIAEIMGVNSDEIYFTSGGTEGDNWVIKGTAFEKSFSGKHLITTSIEHPAVIESYKQLESMGWEVTFLPVNERGVISVESLKKAIRQDTVLVSVMAVNNEIGSIQPIEEIGEVLREYPSVHFHVDAVQAVGKIDLMLGQNSRIDMVVFSGHKFHGPRGIGFVYIKKGRQIAPLMSGGGQETGFRSGTENLPAIVAMAKSLRLLMEKPKENQKLMLACTQKLKDYLKQKRGIIVFSPEEAAPHIVCFGIKGIRGEVTVHALEKHQIYLSTTSACSSRKGQESSTLLAMQVDKDIAETAVRVSLSNQNTMDEMNRFIETFEKVYQQFNII